MKAIKYSVVLFFISVIINACNTKKQAKQSLDPNTKAYFEVKDGSKYTFTDIKDSNVSIEYTSSGYNNSQSNPDIENVEILSYNLTASGQKPLNIRCETGGGQYKDRIALITNRNDTNFAGPIIFNSNGEFTPVQNSTDSIYKYTTYTIGGKIFDNVLRVVMKQNLIYTEVYFAKNIGLIAKKERTGIFLYAKKYSVIQ